MLALISKKDNTVVSINQEDTQVQIGPTDWVHGAGDGWENDDYRLATIQNPEGPSDLSRVEVGEDGVPRWALSTSKPSIGSKDIDDERDRRLTTPYVIQMGGVSYTMAGTANERAVLTSQMLSAVAARPAVWEGIFRDAANVNHKVNATIVNALFLASEERRTDIVMAGAKLKETVPLPTDFYDDKHWPTGSVQLPKKDV